MLLCLWYQAHMAKIIDTPIHQDNMSMCFMSPYTPLSNTKPGLYRVNIILLSLLLNTDCGYLLEPTQKPEILLYKLQTYFRNIHLVMNTSSLEQNRQ